jgi:hypothetical protein
VPSAPVCWGPCISWSSICRALAWRVVPGTSEGRGSGSVDSDSKPGMGVGYCLDWEAADRTEEDSLRVAGCQSMNTDSSLFSSLSLFAYSGTSTLSWSLDILSSIDLVYWRKFQRSFYLIYWTFHFQDFTLLNFLTKLSFSSNFIHLFIWILFEVIDYFKS